MKSNGVINKQMKVNRTEHFYALASAPSSQVGMDKALNQLSVPLGQLREEVMVWAVSVKTLRTGKRLPQSVDACCWLLQSLRSCVSEVIQAIDNQLSKQDDLQKKKVCS